MERSNLDTAYLLFPVEHGTKTPFEILVPVTRDVVALLLEQRRVASELINTEDRLEELVFRDLLEIAYPQTTGSHGPPERVDASSELGRAVHPSLARCYRSAGPPGRVRFHLTDLYIYLTGMGENGPFTTYEARFSEVMLCDLATADDEDVPAAFRRLAANDPWTATEVLEDNLVFCPNPEPVRDVRSLLSPSDIGPILETPFPDYNVRERAIACLGPVGGRTPSELA